MSEDLDSSSSRFLPKRPERSIQEIIEENRKLSKIASEDLAREEESRKERETLENQEKVLDNNDFEKLQDNRYMDDELEEPVLSFFCEDGYCQYFTHEDIDLPLSESSFWDEEELSDQIQDPTQLINVLRALSLSSDRFAKKSLQNVIINLLPKFEDKLYLTDKDFYILLFNFGANVRDGKLFSMVPPLDPPVVSKLVQGAKWPPHWTGNLGALLDNLDHILDTCLFDPEILRNIVSYLLWMSLDANLRTQVITAKLQKCVISSLYAFEDENWFSNCERIAAQLTHYENQNKWKCVYRILSFIPHGCERGMNLRMAVTYFALETLTQQPIEAVYDGNMGCLIRIIESFRNIEVLHLLNVVSFMESAIWQLDLRSKESCDVLTKALKKFEVSVGDYTFENHINYSRAKCSLSTIRTTIDMRKKSLEEAERKKTDGSIIEKKEK